MEGVPTDTTEVVVWESLSFPPVRVVWDHVRVVAVVGEDGPCQPQPPFHLLFEELDDQVRVIPSLTCLPKLEEVSPGCGGQAPLTPLTHLPSGAPVGALVSASYLVRDSPCHIQVSVQSSGVDTFYLA